MKNDEVTKLFDENTCPEWSRLECFRKGFALASAIRDKEWMSEPVCYQMILPEGDCFDKEPLFGNKTIPLFSKPKEMK